MKTKPVSLIINQNSKTMTKTPEYLKHIPDRKLTDLISEQRLIVDNCVELAQHKAGLAEDDTSHRCEGLYFAQLRYKQLVSEMNRRFNEQRKQNLQAAK